MVIKASDPWSVIVSSLLAPISREYPHNVHVHVHEHIYTCNLSGTPCRCLSYIIMYMYTQMIVNYMYEHLDIIY